MKRYVLHTLSLSTALLLLAGSAQGSEAREYRSADGQFRAVVISLPHAADGSGESRVEIHAASSTLLCAQDHGSADGQHGYGVERAAWTPDSRFFVYSLSSSGGHQPWHFPTHFIAVRGCKMRTLDDDVGPITAPDFKIRPPDIVQLRRQSRVDLEQADVSVALGQLASGKKRRP